VAKARKKTTTLDATADQLLEASKLLEGSATLTAGTKLEVWAAVISPSRSKNWSLSQWLQFFIQKVYAKRGGLPYKVVNINTLTKEVVKESNNSPLSFSPACGANLTIKNARFGHRRWRTH
jgi:hypothetical protein